MKKILNLFKEKISPVLAILIVINTVVMLISNIIAVKTFPLFNINGLQMVLPCAVIVFPITYILSDIFSEVYGYKWSRLSAWLAFMFNLFMVAVFELAIVMPGETDLSVLHSTWFLLIASLTAYMVGDLINDLVFRKLKKKHGDRKFWVRAILSSLCGELCDSIIYIPLGMVLLPSLFMGFSFMSWEQALICILIQPMVKVAYELLINPLTKWLAGKLKKYEENLNDKLSRLG